MRLAFIPLILAALALAQNPPPPAPAVPPEPVYPRIYLVPVTLPKSFAAAGVAWNQYASPQINVWGSYAHLVSASAGLYSFNSYDVTSVSRSPFRVQTSVRPGFAIYLRNFGRVYLFALGDAGIAVAPAATDAIPPNPAAPPIAATNLGFAYSAGWMGVVRLGKGWSLVIPMRTFKSALSDRQTIIEIGFGWGQ